MNARNDVEPPRASAIVVRRREILLMRRVKAGEEYYIFPGGGVDMGEAPADAAIRELQEEFGIGIEIEQELFSMTSWGRVGHYFLVRRFSGTPVLGGEERLIMSETNQFHPAWLTFEELETFPNVRPDEARREVIRILKELDAH